MIKPRKHQRLTDSLLQSGVVGGAQGPRNPTMFMCLAICATCVCHLVIFISEENLFVDAIKHYRSSRRQHFTCMLFDIATKQLLHLLVS